MREHEDGLSLRKRDDIYRGRTQQTATPAAHGDSVIERLTRRASSRAAAATSTPLIAAERVERAAERATPGESRRGQSRFELIAAIAVLDIAGLTAFALLGTYQPFAVDGVLAIAGFIAVAVSIAVGGYRLLARRPSRATAQLGYSLFEALAVIAVIGLIALVAVPAFATFRRRNAMISAANELRATMRLVRARAVDRDRHAGIKFTQVNGSWWYSLYDDGDNDGIRSDDIRSGVDVRYAGPSPVMPQLHNARIGLLPYAIKDPDGDPLPPSNAAVNFNNSTICSFSPLGSATPGTIYLTDDAGGLYCVRVYGASGRVRVLRYDGGRKKWELR